MRGEKTRCSGQWTESRYRSFIISLLRAGTMRWRPKYDAIKRAFVKDGLNPATGRKCKLHKCEECGGLFAQGDMHADHIESVVDPVVGFVSWDQYISRMFVEQEGFRAICHKCHHIRSQADNLTRAEIRRSKN
jgi:hypothetical protein